MLPGWRLITLCWQHTGWWCSLLQVASTGLQGSFWNCWKGIEEISIAASTRNCCYKMTEKTELLLRDWIHQFTLHENNFWKETGRVCMLMRFVRQLIRMPKCPGQQKRKDTEYRNPYAEERKNRKDGREKVKIGQTKYRLAKKGGLLLYIHNLIFSALIFLNFCCIQK